jgi:hypothetical protein
VTQDTLCGEPLTRKHKGKICGRPAKHNGDHRSVESIFQKREHKRTSSEYRDRANARNRIWSADNRKLKREIGARSRARQLMRGERIANQGQHHEGMAKLKEWMGDPRPEGMQLSLYRFDSPSVYEGVWKGQPYLLSMNPLDYRWETQADNLARDRARREAVS